MTSMRNSILGAMAGLLVGTIGALAYSHFTSDSALADLQAKLDAANADLAKSIADKGLLAKEASGDSSQVDELQASNKELKTQLDAAKAGTPVAAPPPAQINPVMLAGMVMGMMRGGGMQPQQHLFLLQTRLKLTPDQNAKIKAALEADANSRRDAMRAMFRNGGKPDPNAPATNLNTLDKVLDETLTAQQKAQYLQVQADEKASRAEAAATVQISQMAPLLQFSDTQKEQVLNSLYTVQNSAPDPMSLIGNPDAMTAITKQAQATQDALAKVLTPDQLSLYQQQAALTPQPFGGRRNGPGGNNGGTAGTNATGGAAPAAATTTGYVAQPAVTSAAAVPTPVATTPATTTDSTAGTNSTTTAAPVTNGAPVTQ